MSGAGPPVIGDFRPAEPRGVDALPPLPPADLKELPDELLGGYRPPRAIERDLPRSILESLKLPGLK